MAKIADLSNERWFTPEYRERRPDMMARTRRSLLGQSGAFHAAMWEMIADLNFEKEISAIVCPTLVVAGTADGNAPPAAAEQIARAVPQCFAPPSARSRPLPAVRGARRL